MSVNPAISKLVEKQMRNWELAREQRLSTPTEQRTELADFICLSRAPGAGGEEVAALLAQRLGWALFDKDLLQAMAGDDAFREQMYASMDERDLSWCEEAFRSLGQTDFVKNDYFRRLTSTVLSLARQAHAVFLGRAADLILPHGYGFRARIVAPKEMRIRNYAQQHKMTIEQAGAEVARIEQERADFIRRRFKVDAADPTRHDIIINLEHFSPAQAVEFILAARDALPTVTTS